MLTCPVHSHQQSDYYTTTTVTTMSFMEKNYFAINASTQLGKRILKDSVNFTAKSQKTKNMPAPVIY